MKIRATNLRRNYDRSEIALAISETAIAKAIVLHHDILNIPCPVLSW